MENIRSDYDSSESVSVACLHGHPVTAECLNIQRPDVRLSPVYSNITRKHSAATCRFIDIKLPKSDAEIYVFRFR